MRADPHRATLSSRIDIDRDRRVVTADELWTNP